jgi:hypothetical protein
MACTEATKRGNFGKELRSSSLFFVPFLHTLSYVNQSVRPTSKNSLKFMIYLYTGLFEMIVGVLTTCHTQHT